VDAAAACYLLDAEGLVAAFFEQLPDGLEDGLIEPPVPWAPDAGTGRSHGGGPAHRMTVAAERN
jgi:hypothetical protein